ncbi:MAG: ATP-dependent DNA helicase [Acidobacteriota bacterium]
MDPPVSFPLILPMAIQIDRQARTLSLSVRDLCEESRSKGSLNLSPLATARLELGRAAHHAYQEERQADDPAYRREQSVRFVTEVESYAVTIQGRMDGLYQDEHGWVVEEIKSVLQLEDPIDPARVPFEYLLQLDLYLYLWSQIAETGQVRGCLVLLTPDGEGRGVLERPLRAEETAAFVHRQIRALITAEEVRHSRLDERLVWGERLSFPFPARRVHQDEMVQEIEAALAGGQNLLISASTGIGKTAAALYASLRYALQHGLGVFFLTSKTTQQRIVAQTVQRWFREIRDSDEAGERPPFRGLVLRSKEKMCANDVVFCHPRRCDFANDYYSKVRQSNLLSTLPAAGWLSPDQVYQQAVVHQLCPFELSLDLLGEMDLIVCDYNYVYDPRVCLRQLLDDSRRRFIVIVDEAHNLYPRAREYYSPELDVEAVARLRAQLSGDFSDAPSHSFIPDLMAFLESLETSFAEVIELHPEIEESGQCIVQLDRSIFDEHEEALGRLMQEYLVSRRNPAGSDNEDRILAVFYQVAAFCAGLELSGEEFVHLGTTIPGRKLKVLCLDPSRQLGRQHQRFHSVIAMSATLAPTDFYRDVLGFDRSTRCVNLPSPFPSQNRKIVVIPEVSTSYKGRGRHLRRIAQIIEEIVALRTGNYLAFFPSFAFLSEVAAFLTPDSYCLLIQEPKMTDRVRENLLQRLAGSSGSHLVLAVQGGIFAEGVDYPGELAIGAIIVGPGLPKVDFETELARHYFEQRLSRGFEYAYLYPGMNRVIQSAGRIIRSEMDRGVIALLDKRFAQENYARLFPRDWYDSSPVDLVAQDYLAELTEFWREGQKQTFG